MTKVAFLGLGVMGYPMAGHLAAAGHDVTVFNRTTAKAEKWCAEHKGAFGATPAEAVAGAEIVFACVGNDDDVRAVTMGADGALNAMASGTIFVDHTTASANIAREVSAYAKAKGIAFLDAPVSGGQAGAENGKLGVMIGGEEDSYATISPVIDCYSLAHKLFGPAGSGQLTKMVNQICIAGLVQGLSEGIAFGVKAGLPMNDVLGVITKGAAGSWQMANRGETMIAGKFDYGFALDWMIKDLGICLDEAKSNGANLPVTKIVEGFYRELSADGQGRNDTSSLITRL